MNKQRIVSVVIILALLGLGGFKYYQYKNPGSIISLEEEKKFIETDAILKDGKTSEATTESTPRFSIRPETPVNGTLKGVIEVGASGFNSFVVNIDKDKNWELVSKEFGESLAYEGFSTTEDVKLGLKKYLSKMFERGVSGRNAHFVISSGALKNPKTELIAKAIEQMGYVVNRVTAEQEGKYALKSLLSKNFRDNSFTVDIGSGNTKISWYSNGNITSIEGSGAKYYQDGKKDPDVYQEIKAAVAKVPTANKQQCFIIGGVPFKLAKESRSGDERFTLLKNPDEYSAGDDVKYRSGLNIYRAIYENAGTNQFIFDWDANFTIGFLLTLN